MGTVLIILVFASALISLFAGISALRAGFRLHRTRIGVQFRLFSEVEQLAGRATELEANVTALDARAQALPVRISELQQNLATLRILTGALGTSLRQAEKLLSTSGIKSSLARPLAGALGSRAGTSHGDATRP
jgi:hypothetical protein